MSAKWIQFLGIAAVIMVVCMGLGGGLLMPRLGVEGPLAQILPASVAGALIAILYLKLIKGPDGA